MSMDLLSLAELRFSLLFDPFFSFFLFLFFFFFFFFAFFVFFFFFFFKAGNAVTHEVMGPDPNDNSVGLVANSDPTD